MEELTFYSIQAHPELAQRLLEKVQANSDWREVYGWLAQRVNEAALYFNKRRKG